MLLGHRGATNATMPLKVLNLSNTFSMRFIGGNRNITSHWFQSKDIASAPTAFWSMLGAT